MKILITGAFGNIGRAILDEAIKRGHKVTVFEKESKLTKKLARIYRKKTESIIFGDVCNYHLVEKAVQDKEGIIHLAAIIPPLSEEKKELCFDVNILGTINVVNAIIRNGNKASLVAASTCTVAGFTQHLNPPVTADSPYSKVNNYNESKIEAEKYIRESALESYCITRLGAVMPTIAKYSLNTIRYAYEVPYHTRVEIITDRDVATAQLNAVEKLHKRQIKSKSIYLLGGGNNCRLMYGEFIAGFFSSLGLIPPPKSLFTDKNSFLDWLDTKKAQEDLDFQHDSTKDFFTMLKKQYKIYLPLIKLFNNYVRNLLLSRSPYYKPGKKVYYDKRRIYSANKLI